MSYIAMPSFTEMEFALPAELEGLLAFLALLIAFALRRHKRALSPIGFVLLSLGLIAMALVRSIPSGEWTRWIRAFALTLIFWAVVQIAMEGARRSLMRGRAHFSTTTVELLRAVLYLTVPVLVLRFGLHLDFRVLGVLSTIPAGGALAGWCLRSEFLKTLILQSQRPARPGDWVKFEDRIGRVKWAGFRATSILTTGNESLHVPNSVLNQRPLLNFSTADRIEDQMEFDLRSHDPPWRVQEIVLGLIRDMPAVLSDPEPVIELTGFRGDHVQYRIRYWVTDYAECSSVRSQLLRSLWYTARRSGLKISTDHYPDRSGATVEGQSSEQTLNDLRNSDLLRGLSEEELTILVPYSRLVEFGAGEVVIHEGEAGSTFYVLLHGKVEFLERDGTGKYHTVRQADERSANNFFGEIALLTNEPRSVTVRAVTDLELLEVNRDGFTRMFKARPEAANTIADVASKRLEETRARASQSLPEPTASATSRLLSVMRQLFDF